MVEVPILCFDGDSAGQKAAMRAALRALPLLRPGHSLAFATLPPGQDPDDLVRAKGPQAFQAILDEAEPLVERLWRHEVAAAPLGTPEERAGLKQRLRAITDAIADPDIRSHYAASFRERHDALFFSRPDRPAFAPRHDRGPRATDRRGKWKAPPPPLTSDARAIQSTGLEGAVLRGIIAGLIRFPSEISVHREELTGLRVADRGIADLLRAMLDIAMRQEIVETDALLTILGVRELYNDAKGLLRADAFNFTFTRKEAEPDRARRELAEAIRVMIAGPEIDAALAEATRMMGETFDEASFAAQQKLRRLKADHGKRLADLMQSDDTA